MLGMSGAILVYCGQEHAATKLPPVQCQLRHQCELRASRPVSKTLHRHHVLQAGQFSAAQILGTFFVEIISSSPSPLLLVQVEEEFVRQAQEGLQGRLGRPEGPVGRRKGLVGWGRAAYKPYTYT